MRFMMDFSEVSLFNYDLPKGRIADEPLKQRDMSKLLVVNRAKNQLEHKHFYDLIDLLTPNDVLVLNQSKVFPARLLGNKPTLGRVELLLIQQQSADTWICISHPGLAKGTTIHFPEGCLGTVIEKVGETGQLKVQFRFPHQTFFEALEAIGHTPIPAYIDVSLSEKELRECYQTVFAKEIGSAAAPTAGLHFTKELLGIIAKKGIQIEYVTLHVGLGTFQSLREEHFFHNELHREYFEVTRDVAKRLTTAKKQGKRIIAVGTTTTRTLETVAAGSEILSAGSGSTTLFVHPPYRFAFVDSMITNFHLPKSSLLLLVSAFVSYPNTKAKFSTFNDSIIGKAYREAIEKKYRFYSFGDAMWIV